MTKYQQIALKTLPENDSRKIRIHILPQRYTNEINKVILKIIIS